MKKIKVLIVLLTLLGLSFVPVKTTLAAPLYDWQLVSQSSYPATLQPNQIVNVFIEVENTGTMTWSSYSNIRLGSGSEYGSPNQQRDYSSEFANSDWLSPNRPTAISPDSVVPGQNTKFQFNIKAPATPGTYKAYFTPVVDGYAWMKDIGLYWQITVAGTNNQTNGQNNSSPQPSNTSRTKLGVSDIQNTYGSSVVKLICGDSHNITTGQGSGTLFKNLTNTGYVITTNLHVVKQDSGYAPICLIQMYRNQSDLSSYVYFISYGYNYYSNNIDYATVEPLIITTIDDFSYCLEIVHYYNLYTNSQFLPGGLRAGTSADLSSNSLNVNKISGNKTVVGDGVYVLGYPASEGANITTTAGVVTSFGSLGSTTYVQTNAKINHGVSGGLVINEYGDIIGIPAILETTSIGNMGYFLYLNDMFNSVGGIYSNFYHVD